MVFDTPEELLFSHVFEWNSTVFNLITAKICIAYYMEITFQYVYGVKTMVYLSIGSPI